MAKEVRRYWSTTPQGLWRILIVGLFGVLMFAHVSQAVSFDNYDLSDVPKAYNEYIQQCDDPSTTCNAYSCPNLDEISALEQVALEQAVTELQSNEASALNKALLIQEGEFDHGFFQTQQIKESEMLGVRRTVTTHKFLQSLVQQYGVCQVKNLLEGRCYTNATLPCCAGEEYIKCTRNYPYRSYDGSCNNLLNPTWGRRGNPLKHPIAPCYSDAVSKPARGSSGAPLPPNRMLISDITHFFDTNRGTAKSTLSMFLVFFSEVINGDMIGRAARRVSKPTEGFRGCLADGSDRISYSSPLTNPLRVRPDDRFYGSMGVRCLNFNPQEKANDRCQLKHVGERNLQSSYLDLSLLYTHEPQYDKYGKLLLFQCGASEAITESSPTTVQKVAVAGLFGQLHNYCVDKVLACAGPRPDAVTVRERCRALTIGVYQKIVYDQLLPVLFGAQFYAMCDFNCDYNPHVESAVSQPYKAAYGRFQHTWIPEEMLYKSGGSLESRPFNVFFHDHEQFSCGATLAGILETPIRIGGLSQSSVNKFYTEDGVRGTCLSCLDLARNRDAGLCPLLTYKHYIEQLIGDTSETDRCYNEFEDLSDMFRPELCQLFKEHYESPSDLDALLAILERRRYPGSTIPRLVSQATCLEFKRLKCTDRFFHSWNPYLGEGTHHLIEALNITTLLALFTDIPEISLQPFIVGGPKVAAQDVRDYVQTLDYLFCHL